MKYYGTKDGTEYGFYLDTIGLTQFKEISDSDWENYINQANQSGKILTHDDNGNPQVVDYVMTDEEKTMQELQNAHSYLQQTDYVSAKIAEGVATKEEYAEVLAKRVEMRKLINELESK